MEKEEREEEDIWRRRGEIERQGKKERIQRKNRGRWSEGVGKEEQGGVHLAKNSLRSRICHRQAETETVEDTRDSSAGSAALTHIACRSVFPFSTLHGPPGYTRPL